MIKRLANVLWMAAFVCLFAWAVFAQGNREAQNLQYWEYKRLKFISGGDDGDDVLLEDNVPIRATTLDRVRELGAEGWDLVGFGTLPITAYGATRGWEYHYWFKRPSNSGSAKPTGETKRRSVKNERADSSKLEPIAKFNELSQPEAVIAPSLARPSPPAKDKEKQIKAKSKLLDDAKTKSDVQGWDTAKEAIKANDWDSANRILEQINRKLKAKSTSGAVTP